MTSPLLLHPPSLLPLVLSLGSNLGNRLQNLTAACQRIVNHLHQNPHTQPLLSSIYESTPLNCPPDSPNFFNMVAIVESSLPPTDVLLWLQQLESEFGRPSRRPKNSPRTLDIDILFYGNLTLHLDNLQIPHPRITERAFVIVPLAEIAPHFPIPNCSTPLLELASALSASQPLQKIGKISLEL